MIYTFENPDTKERVDIEQSMSDVHEYTDKNGLKWDRVFFAPNALVKDSIDPFSANKFVDKTRKPDTMGSMFDRAQELSEMRAEKCGGVDPLKAKAEKEWSETRLGRKLPKKNLDIKISNKK